MTADQRRVTAAANEERHAQVPDARATGGRELEIETRAQDPRLSPDQCGVAAVKCGRWGGHLVGSVGP